MKKSLVTIIGVWGWIFYASAQGTFIVDSSVNGGNGSTPFATSGGLVWLDPDGGSVANATLDTSTDVNVTVLWGTTAGTVNTVLNLDPLQLNSPANTSWLVSQPTGTTDITLLGNGALVDPQGNTYVVPGQAVGTTIFLQIEAWTGNSTTFAGVTASGPNAGLLGSTTVFTTILAIGSSPTPPDTSAMSALVLQPVPEPGTFALAGLAAAAMMAFRRRKRCY